MTQYVPVEQLWTEYPGGKLEFEYDHSLYWPALVKLAKDRREARKARWVAGGKQVGELEDYLNGPLEQGVAPATEVEVSSEAQLEPIVETIVALPTPEEAKVEDLKVETLKIDDKAADGQPEGAAENAKEDGEDVEKGKENAKPVVVEA